MPETLETLGGAHGTAIGSFAYLVLQHQTDAEQILASTLATALRRRDWPEGDEAVRRWLLGLASREILRGSSQTGEVAPLLPDPRGRSDRLPMLAALAELDPPARMAVVLYYFCDLPSDVVAAVLDDDPVALRSDLNDARNRLQSRVDEADAVDGPNAGDPPTDHGTREPFDVRLRAVLGEEANRFEVPVDPRRMALGDASSARPRSPRRWWPLAAIAVLATGVAAYVWLVPDSAPTAGRQPEPTASASPTQPAGAPIALADCEIAPADSPLAFAGWTTLAALAVHGGDAKPGQPIYALVTRGMAEWVGWQKDHSGPMYPAPIGRMGCIFDPSARRTSLVGVDQDWEPNLMADGCPPSPIDEFGGYRELGGPRGWLLLPNAGGTSLSNSFTDVMLWRLSPPAQPGQSVSAWAQPLADARPIRAEIGSAAAQPDKPDASGTGSRYYRVDVPFTTAGCWVINIAVDGAVIGSAIVPISQAPMAAP